MKLMEKNNTYLEIHNMGCIFAHQGEGEGLADSKSVNYNSLDIIKYEFLFLLACSLLKMPSKESYFMLILNIYVSSSLVLPIKS